jgi:hypothetical protein
MSDARDFYVSVVNGSDYRLLVGPFNDHKTALMYVEPARARACAVDVKAWWYAFGTCSLPKDTPAQAIFRSEDLTPNG